MKILKTTICLLAAVSFVACGNKEVNKPESEPIETVQLTEAEKLDLGKELFNGKGNCNSCHTADKKVIGPSIQEIMQMYNKEGADIISFLKGNSEPIVDPSQFILMQANIEITKKMTDTELEALVLYMNSL